MIHRIRLTFRDSVREIHIRKLYYTTECVQYYAGTKCVVRLSISTIKCDKIVRKLLHRCRGWSVTN